MWQNCQSTAYEMLRISHWPLAGLSRWFDNSLVTTFRGSLYYDGGLTNFIPLPPGIDVGVRVCCLPARQLKTVYPIDITPDRFESWPYTASEVCMRARLSAFLVNGCDMRTSQLHAALVDAGVSTWLTCNACIREGAYFHLQYTVVIALHEYAAPTSVTLKGAKSAFGCTCADAGVGF